ncbi:MAG: hypothetical protein IKF56_02400 [Eggerthellaceae bacterium]|nr:hypothetical protein [Eggerthellaceae bacterium]
MTLLREYEPATRVGLFELDGLLAILEGRARRLADEGDADAYFYIGAYYALSIIRSQARVEYPHEFLELFKQYMEGGL